MPAGDGRDGARGGGHLVRSSAVDLIVVDSVAALVPRSEIEGEIGMVQVGAHARLMSQALRKINVNAAKAGVTIIFLNQLRSKVGVIYGNPEITTGGNALKFYASVRLDIRRKEVLKGKAGSDDEGVRVKVKVAKNKVAPPYKAARSTCSSAAASPAWVAPSTPPTRWASSIAADPGTRTKTRSSARVARRRWSFSARTPPFWRRVEADVPRRAERLAGSTARPSIRPRRWHPWRLRRGLPVRS